MAEFGSDFLITLAADPLRALCFIRDLDVGRFRITNENGDCPDLVPRYSRCRAPKLPRVPPARVRAHIREAPGLSRSRPALLLPAANYAGRTPLAPRHNSLSATDICFCQMLPFAPSMRNDGKFPEPTFHASQLLNMNERQLLGFATLSMNGEGGLGADHEDDASKDRFGPSKALRGAHT